jgi:cation:H+ antiporter
MAQIELLLSIILFAVGLIILIQGSNFFVGGAVFMAKHFGVSELIIGLTLVSMGTSLPELGASVYASATGNGEIAVGNVVGSNIANIALVLGACLIMGPISIKKKMLKRDGLVMLGVSLLFTVFVFGGILRWEGVILMAIFIIYIAYLFKHNKAEKGDLPKKEKKKKIDKKEGSMVKETIKLVIGCIGVFVGAKLMVDSAIDIATTFNISGTVIGSTLVAFGTSVPELAVSLTAVIKKHQEISIGNIIGSNIFNILWVVGVAAIVMDLAVDYTLLHINIPIMLFTSALLLVFMAMKKSLKPWQGMIFVEIYVIFLFLNYW